ncbi:MAG: hypothetical protein NT124_00985 [Candidatus Dependentiae bacterium]|nr:hypothetical protein [Candidatus Dependentiae bacterium]
MNFIKLSWNIIHEKYSYKNASDVEMTILGRFFTSDVGCDEHDAFRKWALTSIDEDVCGGNCTVLEKVGDNIVLSDEYPVEPVPTKLKMTTKQFVQLWDEWQEKVVKLKPKEVTIKHEHGEFFIETVD